MSRVVGISTSRLHNFIAFQRDPLQFLVDVLGEGDIVSLRTSSFRPTFIVNAPDVIQEILVAKESYFRKGRSSEVLRRTVGDGLLTAEKEQHRAQKKYMAPVFYKERIQNYAQTIAEETEKLAQSLSGGEPLAMHETMMRLTLSIIARSMFATELDERKAELAFAVDDTIRRSAKTLFSPIVLPLAAPTPGNITHRRAIRRLEDMVYDTIRDAKANPGRYADCLVGLLLDTKDEAGRPIPDKEIRDQMMTMLLAGHETTANALVWVWYLLSRHPEAAEKLHREIDALAAAEINAHGSGSADGSVGGARKGTGVYGGGAGRDGKDGADDSSVILRDGEERSALGGESLGGVREGAGVAHGGREAEYGEAGTGLSPFELYRKLTYTQQVVQETLRLYPPAWIILRESEREVELLGDVFPPNSSFLISPYAIHRSERVFNDPYSFRPERFAGEEAAWPRFAYFPFGGGPRGCIGSQFAMMEAVLIIYGLAKHFRFQANAASPPAIPEPLVSLRVKGGLTLIPQRR
ncbi:cytochrome P450 [Paenibacillus thalictri]|uniref:cytochrome P450 n=1 Tax=Paenibacillus thalictri TaxID=2527873 RepID=UPI001F0CF7A4|nr:cytochrome P450 [Paenibacillus thalictri]